jgi:hypothetical protein
MKTIWAYKSANNPSENHSKQWRIVQYCKDQEAAQIWIESAQKQLLNRNTIFEIR